MCSVLPRVALPFDLWLIQHAVEIHRPTNTGRILHTLLPESRILPYGLRDRPFDSSPLQAKHLDLTLLFPDEAAPILTSADLASKPKRRRVLLLLDGTWTQASHLRRRIPTLRNAACARLPPGPCGRWKIRHSQDPARLCTLEAGIRLVRLAGLQEAARRMDQAMDLILARMLFMKGRLPALPTIPRALSATGNR